MADLAQLAQLLKALISGTNEERKQAEQLFNQSKTSAPEQLILGLLQVLSTAQTEEQLRVQAAVLLRQLLSRTGDNFAFEKVSDAAKPQIANQLLVLFENEPNTTVQKKVREVVSKLADAAFDEEDRRGWFNGGQAGWPQLLPLCFRMGAQAEAPEKRETAMRLIKELLQSCSEQIVAMAQELQALLQSSFAHPNLKVKVAGVLLVCEIVTIVEKKVWSALTGTAAVMTQILQATASSSPDDLNECLQAFVEVAETEPDFFKQQLQSSMEPAQTMAALAKSKEAEAGIRNLALEWLVNYVEKKPKFLVKNLPAFPKLAVDCCICLMLEIEDGPQALKEWAERMDDEEGEEDADEMYHAGESAIDRVVEALTMEAIQTWFFPAVAGFAQRPEWQAKHAALATMKQTVEYIEETEVAEVANLLLGNLDHEHPRVRYTALHAIGQLSNDQSPKFQENFHKQVMPALLKKMDDPVHRVAAMSMSAFVSFGEELDNTLMLSYSPSFMEKFVGLLRTSQHRMVQEESITSIAVIAAVMEEDFAQYYDGMMPLLKQFVMNAVHEKQNRLRGKAFECMSLLGPAVGKDKFLPDAKEAIQAMMKSQQEGKADDLQKEYIQEASERIVKCLKQDFAMFLPAMLPPIYASLKMEGEIVGETHNDDGDDDAITYQNAEGKLVKVQTSKFEEATQSINLLYTFGDEMEGAYLDWVQPTCQALLPFLSGEDDVALLCGEVRGAAFQAWAMMIKCAKKGAEARNLPVTVANELTRTFLSKIIVVFKDEDDPDTIREAADGITECLKNSSKGVVTPQEMLPLLTRLFELIDESSKRTLEEEKQKKNKSGGAQGDEDDEDDEEPDEDACRYSCQEAIGAIMELEPQMFVDQAVMQTIVQKLATYLQQKHQRCTGLYLSCNMLKNLKEAAQPGFPVFMPEIFKALTDKDPDIRIPACWAVNLAAEIPVFAEAAPQAFTCLAQLLGGKPPKKKDDQGWVAQDNAVAALLALTRHKAACCPGTIQPWQLIISKLPLESDWDEAKKLHKTLVELVMVQDQGLLGPNASHLGKVLSAFAEIHKNEDLVEKEVSEKILQIFKMIPQAKLLELKDQFSEKQMKKIERMLSA
jgi:hypothetical protein